MGADYAIYCDGASRKDGRGGWGYVVLRNGVRMRGVFGGAYETTNNRMELQAAIEALNSIAKPSMLDIYTDSKYVIMGITEYIEMWTRTNWRTSGNKPVANKDLWQALDASQSVHDINWFHVRGHTGNKWNEEADRLAGLGVPKE